MAVTKYGIQKGDTLSEIAKKKNTTVSELLKLNPQISDPGKISAGATLNVPSAGVPLRTTQPLSEVGKPVLPTLKPSFQKPLTKKEAIAGAPRSSGVLPASPYFGKWGEPSIEEKLREAPKEAIKEAAKGESTQVSGIKERLRQAPKDAIKAAVKGTITEAAAVTGADLGIGGGATETPLVVTSQPARRDQLEAEVKTTLTEGLAKPTLPSYEADFEALRSEHGIAALETQLNTIDQDMSAVEASLRQGLYDIEGKLMPMELIGTRQRELKRQAQEQMDELSRRKQVLTNQYNTKIGLINSIMKLKEMDYNTANAAYNTSFNQAIQIQNLIEGRLSKDAQIANQERDDARANLNVVLKMTADTGAGWTDLDPKMQTQIQQLEMQAGLPIGITQAYMASNPGSSVDYVTTGYDAEGNQVVSFFSYNNGEPTLIKAIETGIVSGDAAQSSEWISAAAFIDANPDASYEELEVALRKDAQKLNSGDIKALLNSKGKTPTTEAEVYLSPENIKSVAISLVKAYTGLFKSAEGGKVNAIAAVQQGVLNVNGKMVTLSQAQIIAIVAVIESEYPKGRTLLQKVLPGGK